MSRYIGKKENWKKGKEPDNPSPWRCFMSITLVAKKIRQINAVDSLFIPSLQIQENMHNDSIKYKCQSYTKFLVCFFNGDMSGYSWSGISQYKCVKLLIEKDGKLFGNVWIMERFICSRWGGSEPPWRMVEQMRYSESYCFTAVL